MYSFQGFGQCNNVTKWPNNDVSGSPYNDTITIATNNYAGDYASLINLEASESYVFVSSVPTDYITIRTADQSTVLGHGFSPFNLALPITIDEVNMHINSTSACGTQAVFRETRFVCITCDAAPPRIGINTPTPTAVLDVQGDLRIGESVLSPEAGTIRFNSMTDDFEGYNGSNWISLTKGNGKWGRTKAETVYPNKEIFPTNGAEEEQMGWAIDMDGDYAVIGTSQINNATDDLKGSAYILKRENEEWNIQQIISAPDGFDQDGFGIDVAIEGNTIVVGAAITYFSNPPAIEGAAYIFKRNADLWQFDQKLTAFDAEILDNFGQKVAIEGDVIAVSAPYDENSGLTNSGAIYVFEMEADSFAFEIKLENEIAQSQLAMGHELIIKDQNIVVNNHGDHYIYVFTKNGGVWSNSQIIEAPQNTPHSYYGTSIDIEGNRMLVGAPLIIQNQVTTGAIDLYLYDNVNKIWVYDSRIYSTKNLIGYMGYSLDIEGDFIVAGTWFTDKVILFEISDENIILDETLLLSDSPDSFGNFGLEVKMNANTILIGEPTRTVNGQSNHGKVHQLNRN